MLNDYEILALDPLTSSLTRSKRLKEIKDYRQLISSDGVGDDDLYNAIKEIYTTIQVEIHKENLDSSLVRKLGGVFSRINNAAEFYVAAKGPFTYVIKKKVPRFPKLNLD